MTPLIYHITRKEQWQAARHEGVYSGDTLLTEGFIHCSTLQQVVPVANSFYKGQTGLVLLEISEPKVAPEIRYEGLPGGDLFPHIYGPLNIKAVTAVAPFEPCPDGLFTFPDQNDFLSDD